LRLKRHTALYLARFSQNFGKFDSKEIAELTSTNTIDFTELGKKKTALYVISSDTHGAYDFLLTIFFAQMIQRLYDYADRNGGAVEIPMFFILDEFANIGRIPDFDKKISTSRSRKISFSVILQNLDQLEAVYEKSFETIIGNCDTTVFLGSNSQKTVEYFSKELGEKTIERDNWSVNKDKNMWRQGYQKSDQIMARPLMTPDELRRLDTDICIIFEKGIKPIKAPKYYYFKYSTQKLVNQFMSDHNDVPPINRGEWRKYNPYNPYVEKTDNKKEDTKIESLDDLFADEPDAADENLQPKEPAMVAAKALDPFESFADKPDTAESIAPLVPETPPKPAVPAPASSPAVPPATPPKASAEEPLPYDVQKELEAKFDELFGAFEDSN